MKPIYETVKDLLPISVYSSMQDMGQAAAEEARSILEKAIETRGHANLILATGNSQLAFLEALRKFYGIDWNKVNIFHMDEYVNIAEDHPASFTKYLHENIVDFVHPRMFYPVPGRAQNIDEACLTYEKLLRENPADLCALGIGENGHLAFNDPPLARFDEPRWVKVVELTDSCKLQQVGEGHFKTINDVPKSAISLTIPALLAAKRVLAIVPEARKADIVLKTLTGPIEPLCPATILRRASHAHLYLDADSGAKIYNLK